MRQFSLIDKILTNVNDALITVFALQTGSRPNPADDISDIPLSEEERQRSEGYMRVNHTGEVCAQALYRGQLSVCQSEQTRMMLKQSCDEETDHLAWTEQRLKDLGGRTSYLNAFWYANSFFIGALAGLAGDRWSLGFVEETEIQVGKHLTSHLTQLSDRDKKSRAIIEKMRDDEAHHEKAAVKAGAHALPDLVKTWMKWQAKVMTTVAYYM